MKILYSMNPDDMQVDRIHAFLSASYWAKDIPIDIVRNSIEHSLVIGAFADGKQIGFARLVTDQSVFAYLCDVYVEERYQGKGIGSAMVNTLQELPELSTIRYWHLGTRDAHELYRKLGWAGVEEPERLMERKFPDMYQRGGAA